MKAEGAPTGRLRPNGRRRRIALFGIVVAIGVGAHVLFFWIASVPLGSGPSEIVSEPWIAWAGEPQEAESALVRDQVVLLDAEPLFVPTRWNSASALNEIARLRDETELFAAFPPRVGAVDQIWRPAPVVAPDTSLVPAEDETTLNTFSSIGREAVAVNVLEPRPVLMEVTAFGAEGEEPFQSRVGPADRPAPANLWTPVEFLLVVDSRTGGGVPLRLNSSGDTGWDQAIARVLLQNPELKRLSSGYYRIIVGP